MNCLVRTLLTLSLLLAAVAPSRGADDKTTTSAYYPLTVGNTWHYKVGTTGFTLKVAKKEKVKTDKGEVEAARVEFISNNKTVSFEHVGVTADAIVRYTFE